MESPDALNSPAEPRWKVRIDTGGTFTDAVAIDPTGVASRRKVLSSGRVRGRVRDGIVVLADGSAAPSLLAGAEVRGLPGDAPLGHLGEGGRLERGDGLAVNGDLVEVDPAMDAPRLAMHLLCGVPIGSDLPPIELRVATTRGTNALLTRSTGRVLLVTTTGFEDLPVIGDQARPDLFDLDIRPPRLLPAATIGVPRHVDAHGGGLVDVDLDRLLDRIEALAVEHGVDGVAVCLLHSWRDPALELELADRLAARLPGRRISAGVAVSPEIRLVPRMRTTIADAALAPVIRRFLEDLGLGEVASRSCDAVLAMSSGGGLVDAAELRPAETLLSGPAAGIVGAFEAARSIGAARFVGFDMGGTSTDVARAEGRVDLKDGGRVGDAEVRIPSVDLHTVAAGGGSICRVVEGRLEVGPESAGADPGPACYGAGGPLTVTDVNLLLDRADPARFGVPLDVSAARRALEAQAKEAGRSAGELLEGFLSLANERMAEAIRTVTTRRGVDPADHLLVAFGGAGGQHACGIADRLGMDRVLVPGDAGLLSAVGLDAAPRERIVERTLLRPLDDLDPGVLLDDLEAEAIAAARRVGVEEPVVRRRQWRCRLQGQDSTIDLDLPAGEAGDASAIRRSFLEAFEARYRRAAPDRPIELAGVRIFAGDADGASSEVRAVAPVLDGPRVVATPTNTTFVEEGWRAETLDDGGLLLVRRGPRDRVGLAGPAMTEIVACRLESIARDMGETLRRTALSVNVKERLDYSCGIVDAEGRLVVNAPHMPVHLGAMGDCVRSVVEVLPPRPGDTILVNHPAHGGSHLPDLTLVTPVFAGDRLVAYVVNRAHHAEIGGTRPGSMPPDARSLVEEGVVFPPTRIVDAGRVRLDVVERMLREAPHPSRSVEENLADLEAQLSANRLGEARVRDLHAAIGGERFASDLDALRDRCDAAVARLVERHRGVDRTVEERLDDGTPIRVRLLVGEDRMRLDFAGSGPVHPGNLNAPFAVVRAAVIYALRVVAGEDIPLNEGVLDRVDLVRCPGLLDPPFTGDATTDPAVAIGNTETSQRVVDALLRVFEAGACSQGTMNNLLLGDETFGYYETICGGAGAGPGRDGCDAVHTHMTNTRITDPEVLETRYPLRLDRFAVRRGSGGRGRWRGGDGVIRELVALADLRGSILGQHRVEHPYGLDGGAPAEVARARVITSVEERELPGIAAFELGVGDRLVIETPGGGGFGAE